MLESSREINFKRDIDIDLLQINLCSEFLSFFEAQNLGMELWKLGIT